MPNVKVISHRIQYEFKAPALLEMALTHRSFGAPHNERLEFLGDALLAFIITDALYRRFIQATEGELTRVRANLVRGETLAQLAHEWDLGEFLNLGAGERKSGGFRRDSILADTVEAIIGAIFLDSDLATCQKVVTAWFTSRLTDAKPEIEKDPKTQLQECLQGKKKPLPVYTIVRVTGEAHEQEFEIACYVDGLSEPTTGVASSRRRAEQIAALKALQIVKPGALI